MGTRQVHADGSETIRESDGRIISHAEPGTTAFELERNQAALEAMKPHPGGGWQGPRIKSSGEMSDEKLDEVLRILKRELNVLIVGDPAAHFQFVPGWIPCERRMPDDGTRVLVIGIGRVVEIATYIDGGIDWHPKSAFVIGLGTDQAVMVGVSHWMPLPEPPK